MELQSYRQSAQEFLERSTAERNDFHAGLKGTLELEPIFAAHAELFSQDAIGELLALHDSATGEAKKRLRHLLEFAVRTALDQHVQEEDLAIAGVLARETEPLDGQELGYHEATVCMANEASPSLRQALHAARARLQARTDAHRVRRLEKLHAWIRELSGMPYLECLQFLMGANFHLLRRQVEAFLAASKDRYERDLALFSARYLGGARPDQMRACDSRFLRRGKDFDPLFPEDRLLSALKRTLFGLGIDLKKQTHIRIDAEERRGKSSQPACFGIRVPQRIYLVLRPHGGLEDYLRLLQQAGHALHLGHVCEDQEFEYKYLGDAAVGETYGALFQYLTLNQDWLEDILGPEDRGDFVQFNRFRKLYDLRDFAARFLFEMELHVEGGYDVDHLKTRYSQLMSQALGFEVSGENFLAAVEDPFYGTSFLRAWIFEAELRQNLEERYGRRWYSRPAAGSFLADLWSFGTRYTVEELAKHIRLMELDLEPIKRDLT